MKYFILIFLISIPAMAQNKSIEIIGGSLTYHLFIDQTTSSHFTNQLTPDGALIYNSMLGFKLMNYNEYGFYDGEAFFMGKNSVNENMGGFIYDFGMQTGKFDVGFATGFYYQDETLFRSHGIDEMNFNGFVPIFGVELNYKTYITKNKFFKVNNFLSTVLTNHTISIGQDF